MTTFVDSNVLIDVILGKDSHAGWSMHWMASAKPPLIVNQVVLAEVAPRFHGLSELTAFLSTVNVETVPLGDEAAFLAGGAHAAYRARGGVRDAVLADFLIGAHASVLGATLLTRDRQRFTTYFPDLSLITPETHSDG